jgi:hypothetical protein
MMMMMHKILSNTVARLQGAKEIKWSTSVCMAFHACSTAAVVRMWIELTTVLARAHRDRVMAWLSCASQVYHFDYKLPACIVILLALLYQSLRQLYPIKGFDPWSSLW